MTTRSWILSKFVTIYPLHTSGEFQVFLSYSCQHLNSELSKTLSRFLQYLIGTQHDMKWTYVLSHIQGDNPQICGWLFGKCVHFEWLVTPCGRGDSLDLGGQSEASIRAWWPMRGRVSGLCSVYLCDDLETESLGPGITVSLSPGPGLSQSAEMAEERISRVLSSVVSYNDPSQSFDGLLGSIHDFWYPCFAPKVSNQPRVTNLSRPERCLSWGAVCGCFENFTNR